MNRRAFLGIVALLSKPLTGETQSPGTVHRIGILGNVPLTHPGSALLWGEFVRGLRDLGYVNGQNIAVDVIVVPAVQNVLAAQRATQTIPIVMVSVGDPVGNGLIAGLARPGGNVTGTSFVTSATVGKQLELLKQIASHISWLAFLLNPENPGHALALEGATSAARSLGVLLQVVRVRGPAELERAFAGMTTRRAGAVFVPWDGTFLVHHVRIVQLAANAHLPALYGQRVYVDAGGLASYGPFAPDSFRRGATYADKILKGQSPATCPSSSRPSSSSSSTYGPPRPSASRSRRRCCSGPTR